MGSDKGGQSSPHEGPAKTEIAAHTQPFTAVNTVASRAASPDSGRTRRRNEQTPSSPEEEAERMNGIIHHDLSPRSSNSSPSVNGSAVRRLSDTPESPRSPPYLRKRSWPEAFGDSDRQESRRGPHAVEHQRTAGYDQAAYDEHDRAFERDRSMTNGHEPHALPGQIYYPSRSQTLGDSEQRLAAEALRRESESSLGRKELPPMLPNSEDLSRQQYTEYDRTNAGVQLDASGKRRKRIFSNRTKTGCMTCRKRKKKCDEQHPECESLPFQLVCAVLCFARSNCTAFA